MAENDVEVRVGRGAPVTAAATGGVSAISIQAAVDLPMLPEMLTRDPSIGVVLSGSKPVDYYVRRVYPSIRVVRVNSQRCRLPLSLLLGFWGGWRIRRRMTLDKVYLVSPYYCAPVMTAIRRLRVNALLVNRNEDPGDYIEEHEPRTAARRAALRFMRRFLKLPVTYYSQGVYGSFAHIVGLTRTFVERTGEFRLSRPECDLGRLTKIDAPLGSGPHVVWMLGGHEHQLASNFPAVFSRINREFRHAGYTPVIKQHPTFKLPRGVRGSRTRKIPRYLPGDLLRFPDGTVIIGMFSTALTTYPELKVFSIAKLCRPSNQEIFDNSVDYVRRLSATVRFAESVEELLDGAGASVGPSYERTRHE